MTLSIGRPVPDCHDRAHDAAARRAALAEHVEERGAASTSSNGEETAFGLGYPLSFHKSLPHGSDGAVHAPSYHAMVDAVTTHDEGALETLPVGRNRTGSGAAPDDPPRHTADAPAGFRGLTSPLTGHVHSVQGIDAGAVGVCPAPRLDTDELAGELAEVYAMALLRDVPFTDIAGDAPPQAVTDVVGWLSSMPWFDGSATPGDEHGARRLEARQPVTDGASLFRGSTPGSQTGHWLSQLLLVGSDTRGIDVRRPDGTDGPANTAEPSFPGLRANLGREDGAIVYGTQVVDQRCVVAQPGVDHMTTWASWLDCQNGVDFNGRDRFMHVRRFLTTPRDAATYVHYDALYQAYLNACLLMLADGGSFPKDPGLPETASRTRSAFASFGGPYALSLVTEVATRALKAVWRQKWLHHRRARPEQVAALLTLRANEPERVTDPLLAEQLDALRDRLPQGLLDAIAAHNTAQRGLDHTPADAADLPADMPAIADTTNYLLPMAFPEGSPTHPAYGAGHATVAGACVTVLKALFRTVEPDGADTAWPWELYVPALAPNEGGELVPAPDAAPGSPPTTITGELDKLAANISIARNMAGVHWATDYHESVRMGERVAASILQEQLGMHHEPVSVRFRSFDGDVVTIDAEGHTADVRVRDAHGTTVTTCDWFQRHMS